MDGIVRGDKMAAATRYLFKNESPPPSLPATIVVSSDLKHGFSLLPGDLPSQLWLPRIDSPRQPVREEGRQLKDEDYSLQLS